MMARQPISIKGNWVTVPALSVNGKTVSSNEVG